MTTHLGRLAAGDRVKQESTVTLTTDFCYTRTVQPVATPGRVGMRLSVCKHAQLYRSASAAGWLTATATRSTPLPTVTDNLMILIVV